MQASADDIAADRQADDHAAAGPGGAGTYLTFDLGGQVLGVDVRNVREILDQVKIRRLPNAPHDLDGIIDIRGRSVPVIDMGARLGLLRDRDAEETRIIVFEVQASDGVRPIGVLADKVRDVTRISRDEIEGPAAIAGTAWDASVLHGFARKGAHLILMLDIAQVFRDVGGDDPAGAFDF